MLTPGSFALGARSPWGFTPDPGPEFGPVSGVVFTSGTSPGFVLGHPHEPDAFQG